MRRVPIDPAGWPFIGGAAVIALVGVWVWTPLAWIAAAAVVLFLFFFRDPERAIADRPGVALGPADGKVMVAGPAGTAAPPGTWQQISIFLSPLDVHVNRVPVTGRVVTVSYRPGTFLPAYRDKAADLNERSEIWIDRGGASVVVR